MIARVLKTLDYITLHYIILFTLHYITMVFCTVHVSLPYTRDGDTNHGVWQRDMDSDEET